MQRAEEHWPCIAGAWVLSSHWEMVGPLFLPGQWPWRWGPTQRPCVALPSRTAHTAHYSSLPPAAPPERIGMLEMIRNWDRAQTRATTPAMIIKLVAESYVEIEWVGTGKNHKHDIRAWKQVDLFLPSWSNWKLLCKMVRRQRQKLTNGFGWRLMALTPSTFASDLFIGSMTSLCLSRESAT